MINAPSNLTVADISPAKIRIYASRLVPATVAVRLVTRNVLPDDLVVQKISVNPVSVRVMIHPRMNPEDIRLETEPLDLQTISSSTTKTLAINGVAGVQFPNGKAPQVLVNIRVKKK
jgi:YbbR domain-containing protein